MTNYVVTTDQGTIMKMPLNPPEIFFVGKYFGAKQVVDKSKMILGIGTKADREIADMGRASKTERDKYILLLFNKREKQVPSAPVHFEVTTTDVFMCWTMTQAEIDAVQSVEGEPSSETPA